MPGNVKYKILNLIALIMSNINLNIYNLFSLYWKLIIESKNPAMFSNDQSNDTILFKGVAKLEESILLTAVTYMHVEV